MTDANSLLDALLKQANEAANNYRIGSRLHKQALEEKLARSDPERLVPALNHVYTRYSAELDPILVLLQSLTLSEQIWR